MRYIVLFFTIIGALFPLYIEAKTLEVGTIERPPFAFKEEGVWKGFSIDIFQKISQLQGYEVSYREYQKFADMIEDTRSGKNDMSVANISVTLEREKTMDFSYPIYDSGLTMMIRGEKDMGNIYIKVLTNSHFLKYLFFICIIFLIFLYRKEIISRIFGKKISSHAYINTAGAILCLLLIVGNYNIFLVQEKIEASEHTSYIFNYEDIGNKKIGVILGSTSEKFCLSRALNCQTYDTLPLLYQGLQDTSLDVVIHDLPILEYYIKMHKDSGFTIVGEVFQPEKYAIVMPNDSPLKEELNRALLQLYADGGYQSVLQTYFK